MGRRLGAAPGERPLLGALGASGALVASALVPLGRVQAHALGASSSVRAVAGGAIVALAAAGSALAGRLFRGWRRAGDAPSLRAGGVALVDAGLLLVGAAYVSNLVVSLGAQLLAACSTGIAAGVVWRLLAERRGRRSAAALAGIERPRAVCRTGW